jgi:hypothetical protein
MRFLVDLLVPLPDVPAHVVGAVGGSPIGVGAHGGHLSDNTAAVRGVRGRPGRRALCRCTRACRVGEVPLADRIVVRGLVPLVLAGEEAIAPGLRVIVLFAIPSAVMVYDPVSVSPLACPLFSQFAKRSALAKPT